MVLMFLGCMGSIFLWVFGMIKSSDAYAGALERARSHPQVIEALGTPIEEGLLTTGSINVSGPSGNADLAIPVSGPKAEGTLYVTATKEAGVWNYQVLQLHVRGGERIDLLTVEPAGVTV